MNYEEDYENYECYFQLVLLCQVSTMTEGLKMVVLPQSNSLKNRLDTCISNDQAVTLQGHCFSRLGEFR